MTTLPSLLRAALLTALLTVTFSARAAEPVPTPVPVPVPIADLFSLPNVRSPRLSPDGKKIAFLFPHEHRMALGYFDRDTKESRLILRGADESISSFFWKGNDRIVFQADISGNESFFIGSTDLTGKKVQRLAESQTIEDNLTGTVAGLIDSLPGDPDRIAVRGYFVEKVENVLFSGGAAIVARLNVRNKGRSPLMEFKDSDRIGDLIMDNAGALRLRQRVLGHENIWEHRIDDGRDWKEISRFPFHGYADTWTPLFFNADNVTLYVISREEHDRGALYAFNTRTMERGPAIFVPPEGELGDPLAGRDNRKGGGALIMSADGDKILGVAYTTDRIHYHWFDADRAALQKQLEETFAGCDVRTTSSAPEASVRLIHVSHDREQGVYFLLDQKAGALTQFKRIRDIDPARLRPVKPVMFTARDGLEIHGYLTMPATPAGKKVPLIIHPHGGPFGIRDYWMFDPEVQFMASRGYAVFQVNYRGSGGYGREFINKGRQQWGRAMQDDLTDAVKWAIAQGFADPDRVAIYGASYGGYASLAGVTLTPELYCCAVNYVGAADLDITFKNRGDDAFVKDDDFSFRTEWVGATSAYRAATSPVNFVERIRVPTLHVYGEKDPRVKIDHWTRLEAQLVKYGKTYESLVEPRQGHGFRDEKAAMRYYAKLEAFFAKYLAPEHKGEVTIGKSEVIDLPAKK